MTYGRSIHHQRLEMLVVAHRQVALVAARAASSPRTLSANHRSALRESLRPGRWRCPASLLAAGSAAAVGQTLSPGAQSFPGAARSRPEPR